MYAVVLWGLVSVIVAMVKAYPTVQDVEMVEPPYEEVECGHRIGGDVFDRIYILKPQEGHVNAYCHVGIPTNVNVLLLTDFHSQDSYARILTGDKEGYKRASEKIYSTPEDEKRIKVVRWFIPGDRAALVFHAANPEDSLGFVITRSREHKPIHYGFENEVEQK